MFTLILCYLLHYAVYIAQLHLPYAYSLEASSFDTVISSSIEFLLHIISGPQRKRSSDVQMASEQFHVNLGFLERDLTAQELVKQHQAWVRGGPESQRCRSVVWDRLVSLRPVSRYGLFIQKNVPVRIKPSAKPYVHCDFALVKFDKLTGKATKYVLLIFCKPVDEDARNCLGRLRRAMYGLDCRHGVLMSPNMARFYEDNDSVVDQIGEELDLRTPDSSSRFNDLVKSLVEKN